MSDNDCLADHRWLVEYAAYLPLTLQQPPARLIRLC
jgi:hypothetical protein